MEMERRVSGGTTRQKVFDGVAGIALPLLCLLADPGVFAGWPYRPVVYSFIGTEIAVLAAWLALQKRLRGSALFFAGPLVAGGGFAFVLGVALLPVSVFGLLVLVGVLGFTPFFTAFAFARSGLRAFRRGRAGRGPGAVAAITLAGVLFALAPSVAVLYAALGGTFGGMAESAGEWASPGFLIPP
ncbi:MAG TPA: hypothetical protein VF950_29520 [Planctomycetota bacterium]